MRELHKKALQAYIDMLTIHIDTKVMDPVFHEETEAYYETLFDITHKIGERHIDLWGKIDDTSLEEKKQQAETILTELKAEIEKYVQENPTSLGTTHLLGELASSMEDM